MDLLRNTRVCCHRDHFEQSKKYCLYRYVYLDLYVNNSRVMIYLLITGHLVFWCMNYSLGGMYSIKCYYNIKPYHTYCMLSCCYHIYIYICYKWPEFNINIMDEPYFWQFLLVRSTKHHMLYMYCMMIIVRHFLDLIQWELTTSFWRELMLLISSARSPEMLKL